MARLKRKAVMETFSVSVTAETLARLRDAADRAYGGNVSALIEAIAVEADRRQALDGLLQRAPSVDDATYADFLREMAPRKKRGRRPAA